MQFVTSSFQSAIFLIACASFAQVSGFYVNYPTVPDAYDPSIPVQPIMNSLPSNHFEYPVPYVLGSNMIQGPQIVKPVRPLKVKPHSTFTAAVQGDLGQPAPYAIVAPETVPYQFFVEDFYRPQAHAQLRPHSGYLHRTRH